MRRKHIRMVLPAVFTVAVMGIPAAAHSSVPAQPTESEPAALEHCIQDLDSATPQCFATYDEAIKAAEAEIGRTLDEQEAALSELSTSDADTLDDGFDIIIGTFFHDENYGGPTFTLYGNSLCSNNDDLQFWYTFNDDWSNEFSSLQPWARCAIWVYSEPDQQGDRDGPYRENTPYVGDFMNDRIVSVALG